MDMKVEGHVNIFEYWHLIRRYRKMIAAVVVVVSIAAVVVSLLLPKIYKAESVIIPISSKGSGGGLAQMAGQFGGLAQMAGINLSGSGGDLEKIMAILKSRTLTENVIEREQLMPILFNRQWDPQKKSWKSGKKPPTMEDAVRKMKGFILASDDKKSKVIKITGKFRDPQLAARVVNAYVDELQKFIEDNAFTMAKRNRIFIEGQLAENKKDLLEAGKEINEFYRVKAISSAEAKVDVPVTRDQQGVNVESGSGDMGRPSPFMAHEQTADASSVIEALAAQKADVEQRIADAKTVRDVPQQVYLSYLMLRRELLGKMNGLLTTQYEMAKIEEAKEDLAFQVIDKAVPPVKRISPKRSQICIMSFMAALFGAIFLAFFRDYLERMRALHRSA